MLDPVLVQTMTEQGKAFSDSASTVDDDSKKLATDQVTMQTNADAYRKTLMNVSSQIATELSNLPAPTPA